MKDSKKNGNATLIFNTNHVTIADKKQALDRIMEIKSYYDVENAIAANDKLA